jgi:hypothetical protein
VVAGTHVYQQLATNMYSKHIAHVYKLVDESNDHVRLRFAHVCVHLLL